MKPLLLLFVITLASCASKKEEAETPPLISQKMASRLTRPDLSRRSIYDKSMQASLNQKSNSGAWFGKQKHQTKAFGTKMFGQTPDYKTKSFSRADEKSRMGGQTFAQAGKVSPDADTTFATRESRFASQTARDANKTFYGANDTFSTAANRDALKSQEKNRRPTFIQLEEQSKGPAYSEDQVRKLMGRD